MYMVDERFLTFLGSHNDALKSDENYWFLPGAGGGGEYLHSAHQIPQFQRISILGPQVKNSYLD